MGQYGVIYLMTFIKPNAQDYYYIGQTTKPLKSRINDGHINRAWKIDSNGNFENNYRVAREIRKYGIKDKKNDIIWDDNINNIDCSKSYIKVETLDHAQSSEELNDKEQYYIIKYHSYEHFNNSRGFNGTLGGYGNSSGVLKGEYSHVAQLTNFEAKQVRLLNRDTSLTYKELADLFKCSLGCIHNIVYDKTYTDALINEDDALDKKYEYWLTYAPLSRKKNTFFYSYDLRQSEDDENRVQMWTSATKCARELGGGVRAQYIYYALAGQKSIVSNHFVFIREKDRYEFEENRLPLLQEKYDKQFRAFSAYDKKTGTFIDSYDCIGTCLKKLNLKNNSPVYKCLNDVSSFSGDYIFIFDDRFTPELLREKMELANPRPFYMFDTAGTQIGDKWTVVKECAQMFKIDSGGISRCLKSQNPYKEKYIFLYADEYNEELLNSIIESLNNKERYLLFNLEGEQLGISNSQYDLYHNKKIFTTSYALKTQNYYVASKGLIIIPESEFSFQKLSSLIQKAKLENEKFIEGRTNTKKKILIYSKDQLILELPNARAAIETNIIPLHAAYRVPRRANKIYQKKYIIIYKEDATPSILAELRKKLE